MENAETTALSNGKSSRSGKGQRLGQFIWQVADLLRGDYKPADYGQVILPFTVLRRLDCILEKTKPDVLKIAGSIRDLGNIRADQELKLQKASTYKFFNTSKFDFNRLVADPPGIRKNLQSYVDGFSTSVRDIFERYKFDEQMAKLDEKDLLYQIVKKFNSPDIDLHPSVITNVDMGTAFEYLIRKFNELSNETAGDHYTPRDAIHLLVDLLLAGDSDLLTNPKPIRTVYDPAAGTGGMLSVAEDRIKEYNKHAKVTAFAQELNDESYAICKADMLFKGQDITNVVQGNTLSDDKFPKKHFDLMACNPPYGVDWKKVREQVEDEAERLGYRGRFGPGLPRISDGQMLFLLHLVSKMRPVREGSNGSRIGIVMSGSSLFTGGAGSGESDIRKYLFEHDYIEAIIGLPTDMFYNTGIATYIWILTNKKPEERKGQLQVIDASGFFQTMRKKLGNKRSELSASDIETVVLLHDAFKSGEHSKVLPNEEFGYHTITVERPLKLGFQVTEERLELLDSKRAIVKNGPDLVALKAAVRSVGAKRFRSRPAFLGALDTAFKRAKLKLTAAQYKAVWQTMSFRDEAAEACKSPTGRLEADPELRDSENVPLTENIHDYFEREIRQYAGADAWIDESKTRLGYEISFTRYFFKYVPQRPLSEIDTDLQSKAREMLTMLNELMHP
ncbi:MAG: N-6 DNA methylase [Candidatus Cybelea sp.]